MSERAVAAHVTALAATHACLKCQELRWAMTILGFLYKYQGNNHLEARNCLMFSGIFIQMFCN